MARIHRRAMVSLGVVVAFVITAVLLAPGDGSDRRATPSQPSQLHQTAAALVRRGVREERRGGSVMAWPFSSLRRPAGGIPSTLRRELQPFLAGNASLKLRLDKAFYGSAADGEVLWIIPGRAVICILRASTLAFACATWASARAEGLLLQTYDSGDRPDGPPTHFTVMGAVPDGVRGVEVRIGKLPRVLPVRNNTFAAEADRVIWIKELVW